MWNASSSFALQRRALLGALALAPLLAMALTYVVHRLPNSARDASVNLAGAWSIREASPSETDLQFGTELRADGWREVRLPHTFGTEEMPRDAWIARTFTAPEELLNTPLSLLVGDTNGGVLRVVINGVTVGSFGDTESLRKTNFVGEYRIHVDPKRLRPGENLIAFRAHWLTRSARIGGPHILLGRASILDIFHERRRSVWAFLVYGPYAIAPLAALLLLAMALVDPDQKNRGAYFANTAMLAAAAAYQDFLVGIASQWLSVATRDCLIYLSIELFLVCVVEFVERYFLRRSTWFGWLSRIFAVLIGAVAVLQLLGVGGVQTRDVYVATSPYGLIVALYSIVVIGLAVKKGERSFALPLLIATVG
ncbi:MAG: hypothetical protein AAFY60_11935, partial [Myxococcota bacterium]